MISYSWWVKSTQGNLTTHVLQIFNYSNLVTFEHKGGTKIVKLKIETIEKATVEMPLESVLSKTVSSSFPLYIYFASFDKENGTYLAITNISHAFNRDVSNVFPSGSSFSSLKNSQNAQGSILVKDHSVLNGKMSTE